MLRRKRTLKGSITVFLSLLLAIVLAAVFVLLEAARVWGLEKKTVTDAVQTSNSLLAEYSQELWEDYHLLFLDASYGTDTFSISAAEERALTFSERNLDVYALTSGIAVSSTWNLFGMEAAEAEITGYELATDSGGAAFCQEAAALMESEITSDVIESIYEYIMASEETEDSADSDDGEEETDLEVTLTENPIDVIKNLRAGGVLAVVLTDEAVSEKEIDLSDTLSERSLQTGTYETSIWSGSWTERILFHEYLLSYYDNCSGDAEGKVLDYELEYLIAGKSTDEANLKAVVNRLILIREAANYAYLQTDTEKKELALAVAAAISAAALSPELIPVIKQAVLAAWAYAESLSDVRLLLSGEKVALVKTSDQWNTDILNLSSSISSGGKSSKSGLTYEQYLHLLLWASDDEDLAYRAMDLIELNEDIRMDTQIAAFEGTCTYTGSPLFSAFVTIGSGKPGTYYFQQEIAGTYLTQ